MRRALQVDFVRQAGQILCLWSHPNGSFESNRSVPSPGAQPDMYMAQYCIDTVRWGSGK